MLAIKELGTNEVEYIQGDIRDYDTLLNSCRNRINLENKNYLIQ